MIFQGREEKKFLLVQESRRILIETFRSSFLRKNHQQVLMERLKEAGQQKSQCWRAGAETPPGRGVLTQP